MSESSSDDASQAGAIDRQQLLLVSLCLLGLLVVAVLAPPPVEPATPTAGGEATPTQPQDEQGANGGSDGAGDSNVLGGDGEPAPVPGGVAPPKEDGCGVVVEEKPVPGTTVTVTVYENRRPVSGARVWFNGDHVGSTDDGGTVIGVVPYEKTLSISVRDDSLSECEFYRRPYRDRAAFNGPDDANLLPDVELDRFQQSSEASTGNYTVHGDVNVSILGDPYPGSSVPITAAIDGVPVRDADVKRDGERVGTTNSNGRYELAVPETQETTLKVSRGDFAGERTIDVKLLEASIAPQEGLAIPGERARVNASVDGSPTKGAVVTLAGRRVGSTTSAGVVGLELPANPAATLTVRTSRQTTTVPVWRVYAPTVGITVGLLTFALVTTGVTYLRRGPGPVRRLATWWTCLGLTYGAIVVGEARGLGVAMAGLVVVGLYRHRTGVKSRGERTAGLVARFLQGCRRFVLRVTVVLERLIDHVRAILGKIRPWMRSLTPGLVLARLRALLVRIKDAVWLYLTVRRVGVALFVVAELVAATNRWHVRGFLASLVGLACLGVMLLLWRRRGTEPGPAGSSQQTTPSATTREAVNTESTVVSLRGLWRRFAQWVAPERWQTSTPGEIARAAVARGFPRQPVDALTETFRDVEYGGASANTRREQARAAYERIAAARDQEEEDR